jgi:tRNA pseudouridine13 synthase
VIPLPLVTEDLPGSGGTLKVTPEDFRVDEVPAYEPAGTGAHLYLHVEKVGRTTREVVAALARALGVQERDAGYAGLKDRQAVTTQWLSFPVARDPDPAALAGDGFRVLAASRHGNKLKPGHLRGNTFALRVLGGDRDLAAACAAALRERGFPNFFGAQRFGREGRNAEIGRGLLVRTDDPEVRRAARDRFLRRLCISAWQSSVFNRWLAERMRDGLFAEALAGDVMKKLETGGLFTCEDAGADGPRVRAFEISPTGPMFGHSMRAASGAAGDREARLLGEDGVGPADLARGGGEAEGTRRAARLPANVEVLPSDGGYLARFTLPKGSYATVVMRELMKADASIPDEE